MGSLGCIVVALTVLVASGTPRNAEAAVMPEEQGTQVAAGGPSLGTSMKHTLRRRAVPLPPAGNVSLAPVPNNGTDTTQFPETVAESVSDVTGASVDPTDVSTVAPMEQGTTEAPSEGMDSEATQAQSDSTGLTLGDTEMPSDATGAYSEPTDSSSVTTERPQEGAGSTLDVTWMPPEATWPTATNTPAKETWPSEETETSTVATPPTDVEATMFTNAETTAQSETNTPSMTEPSNQTVPAETGPVSHASPSSPLTQSPSTAPTQTPSTPPTQSPSTPSTQYPSTPSTQRPSSKFPNLPYMPNPIIVTMGIDEFMGRFGVTRTSSRPATSVAIAGLPSLSKPVKPVPLL
ncbi:uncharacterized protein LOC144125320 isoform X2 [Amblyomma americanum]